MDFSKLTKEQAIELLVRKQQEELERAKSKITIKISRKGGISVYGLGRFPITLYRTQWVALGCPQVEAFINANLAAVELAEKRWTGMTPEQQKAEDAANDPKAKPVSGRAALVDALTG